MKRARFSDRLLENLDGFVELAPILMGLRKIDQLALGMEVAFTRENDSTPRQAPPEPRGAKPTSSVG